MVNGKIGRNDPCPCGSGRKYKHCCLNKETQNSKLIPWPSYPADFAIGKLLETSEKFASYYQNVVVKIPNRILWCHDTTLEEGIKVRGTRIEKGRKKELFALVIRLKKIPASMDEELGIAHALESFILDIEEFPATSFVDNRVELISSTLNSMLHVPIIYIRLLSYGFDVEKGYNSELKEDYRQLEKRKGSPTSDMERVHWIFNYVKKILVWEDVLNRSWQDSNEFQSWFDNRYPDIANEGMELLAFIRDTGYNNQSKMDKLFRKIIQRYKLHGYVFP